MTRRQTLTLLAAGILALVLLAAGLGSLELLPGRPLGLAGMASITQEVSEADLIGLPSPFDLVEIVLALTVWVLLPLLLALSLLVPDLRRELLKRLPFLVGTMLLLFWLLRFIEPFAPREPPPQDAEAFLDDSSLWAEGLPATPEFVSDPPSWLVVLVVSLLAVMLTALAVRFWRSLRPDGPDENLTAPAEEALKRLQQGSDVSDTVMRCYLEMSELLETRHGLRRQRAMTPREFGRQLEQLGWEGAHITRLTGLFERVRYGRKAPAPRDEAEAKACLQAIVQAYGA